MEEQLLIRNLQDQITEIRIRRNVVWFDLALRISFSSITSSQPSRSELNKLINPVVVNQSADAPEQTNDYRTLWNRFKTARFTPKQAARAFKNELSTMQVVSLLMELQKEKLARHLGGDDWILEVVYNNQ